LALNHGKKSSHSELKQLCQNYHRLFRRQILELGAGYGDNLIAIKQTCEINDSSAREQYYSRYHFAGVTPGRM
jgi:hypothetical protein